jgi:hypothetical protein
MTKGLSEYILKQQNINYALENNLTPQSVEAQPAYEEFQKLVKEGVYNG